MTHFNHEWTNDSTAIPEAVGDRYYAQDLNDDFNYLKHLPYEAILQGRNRGVIVPPTDSYDHSTRTLTLGGGVGVYKLSTKTLDTTEDFIIPPKTIATDRYERIAFQDTVLTFDTNISLMHYIIATPTKRSLLQRTKSLLTETYASRIKYDGVITKSLTPPTQDQILIGLYLKGSYVICNDFVKDQAVNNVIKLRKWYCYHGYADVGNNFASAFRQYYNLDTYNLTYETVVTIEYARDVYLGSINATHFINSTIEIKHFYNEDIQISGVLNNCTLENCKIIVSGRGDNKYTLFKGYTQIRNCEIDIGEAGGNLDLWLRVVDGNLIENCRINIRGLNTVNIKQEKLFYNCKMYNCKIDIDDLEQYLTYGNDTKIFNCDFEIHNIGGMYQGSHGYFCGCNFNINRLDTTNWFDHGKFCNCVILIRSVLLDDYLITGDIIFEHCYLEISAVYDGNHALIEDDTGCQFYLTRFVVPSTVPILSLPHSSGRGFIINDTIVKPCDS